MAADAGFALIRTEQPPTKILDLGRVRVVPTTMAGVLALVAVAALAHLLMTSVQERRRELALLGALGFVRRQLQATVAWQASVITMASLVVGVPVGIALGRRSGAPTPRGARRRACGDPVGLARPRGRRQPGGREPGGAGTGTLGTTHPHR